MSFLLRTSSGLSRLGLSASCALLPIAATAQDVATPTPAPTRPPIITTLPGVTPERFTLGSPTPTPVPVPPTVNPTPASTPAPRAAAPTPRPAPAAAGPRTSPSPVPTPTPSPVATPSLAPQVLPAPLATAAPGFEAVPAPAPAPSGSPWLWLLAGAAGSAIIIGGAWALLARRRRALEEVVEEAPVAALPSEPSRGPPARLASPLPLVPAASDDPFDIQLRPLGLQVDNDGATLEVEVLIANLQPGSADNIRIAPAMMSAQPEQNRYIAAFHANPIFDTAAQAFDLAAGAGGRVPVRLRLARDHLHVVETGGRPMFVPMVMIDIRWRAGLSLRRFGADFMVGTAGRGDKLGPIWLDRPQLSGELAATRYIPNG